MHKHCCCRSTAVAGDLASDLSVTGVLDVCIVVPAVAGIPIVVAVTAVAVAGAVSGAAAAGIIAVDDVHAVEYNKGLKEIADSPNLRSGFIDSANCFNVILVLYANSENTAR